MEHSASDLNSPARGFTLVELLIALSLVAVVMGLAWIVMESARKVADEIQSPIKSPLEPFWSDLQSEVDHLIPKPVNTTFPSLRFSEEEGLEMVSLVRGREGIRLQTEIGYQVIDDGLQKITRSGFPAVAQTNLIAGGVEMMQVMGLGKDAEYTAWPPENPEPLFPRLQVALADAEGNRESREFFLPASIAVLRSDEAETETED